MSQEIINVLNYLSEKLGIAIDWTAENVWPQVVDILSRYQIMEIISHSMWLFAEVATIVFCASVLWNCFKSKTSARCTKESNFWWEVRHPHIWITDIGAAAAIVAGIFLVINLIAFPFEVEVLLEWAVVPEIKYLEMLKDFVK